MHCPVGSSILRWEFSDFAQGLPRVLGWKIPAVARRQDREMVTAEGRRVDGPVGLWTNRNGWRLERERPMAQPQSSGCCAAVSRGSIPNESTILPTMDGAAQSACDKDGAAYSACENLVLLSLRAGLQAALHNPGVVCVCVRLPLLFVCTHPCQHGSVLI